MRIEAPLAARAPVGGTRACVVTPDARSYCWGFDRAKADAAVLDSEPIEIRWE